MFRDTRIDQDVFDVPFAPELRGAGRGRQDDSIFEAAEPDTGAVDDYADRQIRSAGMATALAWLDEGDFSFSALDVLVVGMVDVDGDDEIGDDEEADYNDLLTAVAEALVRLGGAEDNVAALIDDEDDAAGEKLGKHLTAQLESATLDDDEIVTRFAMRSGEQILEAGTRKIVRDGKVVIKKKRIKKYRMTAAQRQSLKKARRKAHSAGARRARAKSLRIRKKRGL